MSLNKETIQFYENLKYRSNVLVWYPFKSFSDILYVGHGCKAIENYLKSIGNLCTINSLDGDLKENFDYIVIDGYLDTISDKEKALLLLNSKLKKCGQLIILTNNKLGIRHFAGVKDFQNDELFGNFKNNNLYSKIQWENLFNKLKLFYLFYYPFPDYYVTNQIFSEIDKKNHVNFNYDDFHDYRFTFFDEKKIYDSLIETGEYPIFSNSFMIILSNIEIKNKVYFTKISNERRREFQIFTSIIKNDNKKIVEKHALDNFGNQHLENIANYYKLHDHNIKSNNIKYCPVQKKDLVLYFDYIDGKTCEELIRENVEFEKHEEINKIFDLIYNLCLGEKSTVFSLDEKFYSIFSKRDYSILKNQVCSRNCNFDLIPENIIKTEKNEYYIIDYEWIFDIYIPISFIMFRSIFHCTALSKYEKINELYERFGINEEMRTLFLEMELDFQNYVSKDKLSDFYQSMNLLNINIVNYISKTLVMSIKGGSLAEERKYFMPTYIRHTLEVANDDQIVIEFNCKAIFKILYIKNENNDNLLFNVNADIHYVDDYYCPDNVQIKINCKNSKVISFEFLIYYYGDNYVDNIISLTKEKNELEKELNKFKKKLGYRVVNKLKKKSFSLEKK